MTYNYNDVKLCQRVRANTLVSCDHKMELEKRCCNTTFKIVETGTDFESAKTANTKLIIN